MAWGSLGRGTGSGLCEVHGWEALRKGRGSRCLPYMITELHMELPYPWAQGGG